MVERLVDVLDSRGNLRHVFPIRIEGSGNLNSQYEKKALEAAIFEKLVPDNEVSGLTARMHISRSGPLEPYADDRDARAQTKASLDQILRERAYALWEQEGRPEGGPPSIGSLRRNSTFTSALTLSGNRRGGRKGELTNIWTELVNLKSLNHWKRLIRISLPAPSARCVSRRSLARLERGDRGDRRYPAQAADKKRRGAL